MAEKNILINGDKTIGIKELRTLHDIQSLNRALNKREFLVIMSAYKMLTDRLSEEAEKQGITI